MEAPNPGRCSRRDFLKTAALSAAALAVDAARAQPPVPMPASANAPRLPRRPYGKSAIPISIIGMGGIVVMNADQAHANRIVAEFVERGVNYFDVAPSYGDAEVKLGPALEPYRRDCFLACKTTQRLREGAAAELQRSLATLRTDHFDLYQLHAITDVPKDLDTAFAAGGAMEVLIEARRTGQIRHLGFSAHSVEAALTAMDRFDFDSILFPVNFATYHAGNFGPQIMARAEAKGVTRLALKALARQKWTPNDPQRSRYPKCWYQPLTDPREAELALRFTLGQPVAAALPPGDETLFRLALDLAPQARPLSPAETQELVTLAAGLDPVFRFTGAA